MIDKGLALSLLRVVQSSAERVEFGASATLRKFVTDSGIGLVQGEKVFFNEGHKERIRAWLNADNIDPDTPVDAWSRLGRAEALDIGPNEKWAGEAVRAQRIAIKALKGRPLLVDSQRIYLPPLANMEWSCTDALQYLRHDAVIVVENWEAFERIDDLKVDLSHVSTNPLILWRGGGAGSSVGTAMRFVEAYGRPVWSAPDYDPEGLAIASRLPHLVGVLAPQDNVLRRLLAESKLHSRYSQQLPGALASLEQATHPDVKRLWALVRASANALPQERLCPKP
ncbi:hypothetical protein AB4Z27_15705 [Cupriavidus sp. KB_39]|jgi:hypothetical protein|uniref:DUF7281 domain-containing protein n=1 Tax=Cupriavidus sp. KB_39 TaxID=3233036 RepID=UPI003F9317DC